MSGSTCPRTTKAKCRVLYVGDDGSLVAVLRKALTDEDYQIVSCADRETAIMFLKSEISYQLLLIDFEWRGSEGLKLASLASLLKHRKEMPVVLVTASELSRPVRVLARTAGVNECVLKDVGAIVEAIIRLSEGQIEAAD